MSHRIVKLWVSLTDDESPSLVTTSIPPWCSVLSMVLILLQCGLCRWMWCWGVVGLGKRLLLLLVSCLGGL